MTKRKIRRYSEAFRQEVVREYEAGSSIAELRKKYGIGGQHTIQVWVEKYSHSGLRHQVIRIQRADEANRVRELEVRVRELEAALGKVTLEKLLLESTLEVIEIEAKKNAPVSCSAPMKKGNTKPGSR